MDEGLRWGEPPKIPIMERVRVATFSFGLGFAGAVISQFIFARINRQPINRVLWKSSRNSGVMLGTALAVGSQLQISKQYEGRY